MFTDTDTETETQNVIEFVKSLSSNSKAVGRPSYNSLCVKKSREKKEKRESNMRNALIEMGEILHENA